MYRELLRVKAVEGKEDKLRSSIMKLAALTASAPGFSWCKAYEEVNNPGWFSVDFECGAKEDFINALHSEAIGQLDADMKASMADALSCVMKEL